MPHFTVNVYVIRHVLSTVDAASYTNCYVCIYVYADFKATHILIFKLLWSNSIKLNWVRCWFSIQFLNWILKLHMCLLRTHYI